MVIDGLTIEDYEALPGALAVNHELEEGKLVDVSGNTLGHNRIRDLLSRLLDFAAQRSSLGMVVTEQEYDFDGNAHAPDISLITQDDLPKRDRKKRVQRLIPKLAIEIASENDRVDRLMRKAVRYRACGTHEVWLFLPETRQALQMTPSRQVLLNADQLFQPDSIPGVSLTIAEVLDLD